VVAVIAQNMHLNLALALEYILTTNNTPYEKGLMLDTARWSFSNSDTRDLNE
jgi:hypothetical protein